MPELIYNIADEVGSVKDLTALRRGFCGGQLNRLGDGLGILRRCDVFLFQHLVQHPAALAFSGIFAFVRIKVSWPVRQAGDESALGKVKLLGMFVEVNFGGGFDPVGSAAVVDLVQVHFKHLLLCVAVVDLRRDNNLVELAPIGLLASEAADFHVPCKLLGDGAAAFAFHVAVREVIVKRPDNSFGVNAGVLIEAFVFKGNGGVLQVFRHGINRDDFAPFPEELGERRAVRRVEIGDAEGIIRQINRAGRAVEPDRQQHNHGDQCNNDQERDGGKKHLDPRPHRVPPPFRRGIVAGRRGPYRGVFRARVRSCCHTASPVL